MFSQIMAFLPLSTFARCVAAHHGEHKVKDFSRLDQFRQWPAQLTGRESLRDIEAICARHNRGKLYHMGFAATGAPSLTLADALNSRDLGRFTPTWLSG